MKIHLNITQECIDCGTPGEGSSCAVALALDQAGCGAPNVDSGYVRFTYCGVRYFVDTPDAIIQFIDKYDQRDPVSPFEIDLDTEAETPE